MKKKKKKKKKKNTKLYIIVKKKINSKLRSASEPCEARCDTGIIELSFHFQSMEVTRKTCSNS